MGEAANKVTRDDAHKRVIQLRDEITRKRELLTMELDELRRRRADAVVRAQQTARMALGAAAGMMVVTSLLNAVADLFRKDKVEEDLDDEPILMDQQTTKKIAKKQATSSAFVSAVVTLLMNELRKMAIDYAKRELRTRLSAYNGARPSSPGHGNGNGNGHGSGNGRSVA